MYDSFPWYLGTLLILIYALGRFNRPKTNRVSTTRVRFYSAATAYCAATFLLYVLLAGLLTDSPEVLQALQIGAAQDGSLDQLKLSGPLLAALALTVLLPNFPLIAQVDERLLKFFQALGNIPLEAILQSEQLYRHGAVAPGHMRDEVAAHVRNKLEVAGITMDDLAFDEERESPKGYWTVLLSLMLQIEAWRSSRTYAGVFNDLEEEYAQVRLRFEKLTSAAARYFRMLRELPPDERAPSPFLMECNRNFRDQCDELYREICRLVARSVLKCEWTRADRNRTLTRMGFKSTNQVGQMLSPNQVVAVVAMVFGVILIAVTLTGSQIPDVQRAFFMSIMVATIYGTAIVCAVLLKGQWPGDDGERPVLGYLASGIVALGMAALVSVAFKSLLLLSFFDALTDLRFTYPYLALAFMAAAATAFLCDDFAAAPEDAPRSTRWLEGIGAALVLSGTAYFVWLALVNVHGGPDAPRVPTLERFLPTTAMIGLIIGSTVPTWYRNALRRQQQNLAFA